MFGTGPHETIVVNGNDNNILHALLLFLLQLYIYRVDVMLRPVKKYYRQNIAAPKQSKNQNLNLQNQTLKNFNVKIYGVFVTTIY